MEALVISLPVINHLTVFDVSNGKVSFTVGLFPDTAVYATLR